MGKQKAIKHIKIIHSIVSLCLLFIILPFSKVYALANFYEPILISSEEAKELSKSANIEEAVLEVNQRGFVEESKKTKAEEPTKEQEKEVEKAEEAEPEPEKETEEAILPYEPEDDEEEVPESVIESKSDEDDSDMLSPEEAAKLGIILNAEPVTPEIAPVAADASATVELKQVEQKETDDEDKKQTMEYAKNFFEEDKTSKTKRRRKSNLNISGTKTFEIKKSKVRGDITHFSTEQYDSYPGFKMDQSLHLEIDGNINENSTVNAILDDKDDEDRRFTVSINTPKWQFVLGDFNLKLENTEFSLFSKEVRGIIAQGNFNDHYRAAFLFAQSKGAARREQFRGAGSQQEYRLQAFPIVQNSEIIKIDGKLLTRNTDYLIDYEEGIIKFSTNILPIEITRWITIEYETSDENMSYSRNIFGTRHEYIRSQDRHIGLTWLREVDGKTPKSGSDADYSSEIASGTASSTEGITMPMQHDVFSTDLHWRIGKVFSINGETAISTVDPNTKSNATNEDKSYKGHASKFGIEAKTDKFELASDYYNIDKNFKLIGREDGVIELGERGLVNDVISARSKMKYKFTDNFSIFADGEDAETNLDNDPNESKIDFEEYNGGFVWTPNTSSRLEIKAGSQKDSEKKTTTSSNVKKDTANIVYDKKFGKTTTQTKFEKTKYEDGINIASGSEITQADFSIGSKLSSDLSWNMVLSKIEMEDGYVKHGLRSDTRNYTVDVSYEPSNIFSMRGQMQWRREDDFYENSRAKSSLVDSQIDYEPNRNLKSQLKYKVENTSKVVRDDTLDRRDYVIPDSLPTDVQKELQVYGRFETPVQKATTNFTTDYRINDKIQTYLDWKRRDIEDRSSGAMISRTDRKNYELRYAPIERMLITTEYEVGLNRDKENGSEVRDNTKTIQIRHEFKKDYTLELSYEISEEDDIYDDTNDENKKSSIANFQRVFSPKVTFEFGLQYDDIIDKDPSKEFEKSMAFTLTPSSRNQRYKFFLKHRGIKSTKNGEYYEGGVNLSQFIGSDTIIDGEIKKVHSSNLPSGDAYDATVINAKMIITF